MLSTLSGIGLMSTHQPHALKVLDVDYGDAYPFLVSLHPYWAFLASLATHRQVLVMLKATLCAFDLAVLTYGLCNEMYHFSVDLILQLVHLITW